MVADAAKAEAAARGKMSDEGILRRVVDGRLSKWFADAMLEEQEMLVEVDGYEGKARSMSRSVAGEVVDAIL